MSDHILIKNLRLRIIVGINDWEREKEQDVIVNLRLFTDTTRAAVSDDIADCVNYRSVTKRVIALAEESRFFLVEKLADAIARICCLEFGVPDVEVQIEKPGALRFADSVGVCIRRRVDDYTDG